jgi:hypothetical protein
VRFELGNTSSKRISRRSSLSNSMFEHKDLNCPNGHEHHPTVVLARRYIRRALRPHTPKKAGLSGWPANQMPVLLAADTCLMVQRDKVQSRKENGSVTEVSTN